MEQAYSLGISVYAPTASVVRLDQTLKTAKLSSADMARKASETRAIEIGHYRRALAQMRRMNAPDNVVQPYASAIVILSAPLVITDSAKTEVPGDPLAQTVWSTLDEAERIAPPNDGLLEAWLKLTQGRDALWAYHLGETIVVAEAGIPGDPQEWPLIDATGLLAQTAPATTPQPITDALKRVADELKRHKIYSGDIQALTDAVADVFGNPLAR